MNQPITSICGIAAPLLWDNVDTDALAPAAPHKALGGGTDRLREILFYESRFDEHAGPKPDFVLNMARYQNASILVAGENFGCGSSREHAVLALKDFGFSAVIARSFAEIFEQNTYKNRLLPAVVDAQTHCAIVETLCTAEEPILTVDLVRQCILADNRVLGLFQVDELGLEAVVNGTDEFSLTARHLDDIRDTQRRLATLWPWLAGTSDAKL